MPPQISIVIPAFNSEEFLPITIQSVREQTFENWELVIVDDGSEDGTPARAEDLLEIDRRIRVVKQQNAGVASARNRGFAETSPDSDFVIFLDHDDRWRPDCLSTLLHALRDAPECVAAHGLGRYMDENGCEIDGALELYTRMRLVCQRGRHKLLDRDQPTTFEALLVQNSIVTPGLILIRRSALVAAGGFDSDLAPSDDWDMWIRLSLQGPFKYVEQIVLLWRIHKKNRSHGRRRLEQSSFRVRRKWMSAPECTPKQRRAVRDAYRLSERITYLSKFEFAWSELRHLQFRFAALQLYYGIRCWLRYVRGLPIGWNLRYPGAREDHVG